MSDFITVEDLELFAETLGKELGVKWFRALRRIGFRISGSAQLGNVAGTVSNTSTQRPRGVNVRVETTQGAGEQVLTLWECCPVPFENIEAYVGKRFTIGYPPDRPDELHVLWPSSIDRAAFGQRTAMEQMQLAFLARGTCEGRLTLVSGDPMYMDNTTGATTLYYTPHIGDRVALYSSTTSTWRAYKFAELSIAIPASTNTNYDVYIYNNAGTITLELTAWTDATTRATAITRQDGVFVKSGSTNKRYLGTIRTTGNSGECDDSATKRFCWNYYHQKPRLLLKNEADDSWTYGTQNTFRQVNADSTNKVETVAGYRGDIVINAYMTGRGTDVSFYTAIGKDSTTTKHSRCISTAGHASTSNYAGTAVAAYVDTTEGYHAYNWLETPSDNITVTFYNNLSTGTASNSGLSGWIMG